MISSVLKNTVELEHEAEQLASDASGEQASSNEEKMLQDSRKKAEQIALQTVRLAEGWGKEVLTKNIDQTEVIL